MELIHKRGTGATERNPIKLRALQKDGFGSGPRRVTDGNTNVDRRSAADACQKT